MKIQLETQDDLLIARMDGRFLPGRHQLYRQSSSRILESGCKSVLLDWERVNSLDSTGLGFLIALYNGLNARGAHLALTNANARVRKILALTRLDTFLTIYENERAAREALAGVLA